MKLIFIVADALGRDHLGCYGYKRKTSPFLDEYAQEGVLFENFYKGFKINRFMPFLNKLNYFLSCFRSYSNYLKFFTIRVKDTICDRILVKVNTYKSLFHGFSPFCFTGERLRFSLTYPDARRGNRAFCPGGVLCLV